MSQAGQPSRALSSPATEQDAPPKYSVFGLWYAQEKDAAKRRAEALRQYWRRQGFTVITWIAFDGYLEKRPVFGVRSDLVRGLPAELLNRARKRPGAPAAVGAPVVACKTT
ncbi:MAG: hypothetical protein U1A72_16920 [Sulfuritalea sp.]|nr:hypothetical protein [Sulfuritalea sp.]